MFDLLKILFARIFKLSRWGLFFFFTIPATLEVGEEEKTVCV